MSEDTLPENITTSKSKKYIVIIYCVVFSVLAFVLIILYLSWYDRYTTIAEEDGDYYILDSMVYEFSYDLQDDIKSKHAEITDICLGKSKNGSKIYYVRPYGNLEYIAIYAGWDGAVYKKVGYKDLKN